jgi:cyclic pyranopterin phosphate synthase
LPGNPVSAAVTFNLFTRTALLLMQNARNARLAEETAALGGRIKRNAERTSYLPAKLSVSAEGVSTINPLRWGGSSDFVAFSRANALAIVEAGEGFLEQARSCASHVFHEIKFLMTKLTHTDADGRATMVDVSGKTPTERRAVASARVLMNAETISAIREARTPKGDPLETARLAGIMAAKRTDELIPLCHSLPLSHVDVRCAVMETGVNLEAEARTVAGTGVEMEALTAVTVAALTLYDMCKAIDKGMQITDVQLESKSGGKSGEYRRNDE